MRHVRQQRATKAAEVTTISAFLKPAASYRTDFSCAKILSITV